MYPGVNLGSGESTRYTSAIMRTFIASIILILLTHQTMAQHDYATAWKKVDSLENLGQFQTARDEVMKIYRLSKEKGHADQQIRALLVKAALEENFMEESWEEAIAFTENEIGSSPVPVRQVLWSIQAGLNSRYYQMNSWKINGRTPLTGNSPGDLTTRDAAWFAKTTTRLFLLSLSEADTLKQTPLSQYQAMLTGDGKSRKYRPTLYDFLAFRALAYFSGEKPGMIQPSRSFTLNDPHYFGPRAVFTELSLLEEKDESFEGQAYRIYRDLLLFRAGDSGNRDALADADLARLAWVYQKSNLPQKDSLYTDALLSLFHEFEDHPVAADILYALANQLRWAGNKYSPAKEEAYRWKYSEALQWAEKCIRDYPGTDGAHNCTILAAELKATSLRSTAPKAVVPGKPSLTLLQFKNLEKVWFRIIPLKPEEAITLRINNRAEQLKTWLDRSALTHWEITLPVDSDYRTHTTEVQIPALKPGYYLVAASSTPHFDKEASMALWPLWSSRLSLVERRKANGDSDVMVIDRENGVPLENVKIVPWFRRYDLARKKEIDESSAPLYTNARGEASVTLSPQTERNLSYFLELTLDKEKFITPAWFAGYYRENENTAMTRTFLFTDRAIYRPGQTVWYKGIVVDLHGNDHTLKENFEEVVTLRDVNGQEIAVQKVVTSSFGSFTGSFILPASGLTGVMSISCLHGSQTFRMEEYKRPKFEVVFDPVEGAPQLHRVVVVKGKATAYAGSPVTDAAVTWRVVRNARFPRPWWLGTDRFPMSRAMEIASGTGITGPGGEFEVRFPAIPDEAIAPSLSPVFTYTVQVTVADASGETHDARSTVSAGYESLILTTNLGEAVNRDEAPDIEVTATNLDKKPEKVSGEVTVSRITPPARIIFPKPWSKPDRHLLTEKTYRDLFPGEIYGNEEDRTTWPVGETVLSAKFETPGKAAIPGLRKLEPGHYVLNITTSDTSGKAIRYSHYFTLFSPEEGKSITVDPLTLTLLTPTAEPGQTASFLISTPLRKAHVKVLLVSQNSAPRTYYFTIDNRQMRVDLPITEADRGNIAIRAIMARENRVFQEEALITVPWSNKKLDITVGSFRDKLLPGAQEEWRVTIRDKNREPVAAELMATLYDASLDIFSPLQWYFSLYHPLTLIPGWDISKSFGNVNGMNLWTPRKENTIRQRSYEQLTGIFSPGSISRRPGDQLFYATAREEMGEATIVAFGTQKREEPLSALAIADVEVGNGRIAGQLPQAEEPVAPALPPSKPRTDFRETAFFFPRMATNENGETILRFSMPEALTRWRMMGLAHTRDLKSGTIDQSLITQKELMVFPNVPRFLREGDVLDFSARVSNLSDQPLEGTVTLQLFDALTMTPVDRQMNLTEPDRHFSAGLGEDGAVNWKITVPAGIQAVVYRVTATAGHFSDGEEASLPVLTNRMLVTESLPLPVRGTSAKSFTFDKLVNQANQSTTLRNHRLTLEYSSNPVWYAVQALPYLMESPHECAEQVFSRYYANTLATSLAQSDPAIRRIFDAWKNLAPDALKSNLEKNEALKSVILQETPWVRDAAGESERKQRIGLLFDAGKMAAEQQTALKKLTEMQTSEGGWPWFPEMPQSVYITRHILAGIGHLARLGSTDFTGDAALSAMTGKAIAWLDAEKLKAYRKFREAQSGTSGKDITGPDELHYLYARSFFLTSHPFGEEMKEMVAYYSSQAAKGWKERSVYLKAMTALALHRMGDSGTAGLILRSLSETALRSEEMGMYWRDNKPGWFWYEAPIETQALLIEAYEEISGDAALVDEMKVWLLKQKETQDWKSTKATAEAVYALLKRGTPLLAESWPVSITLGGKEVNPHTTDAPQPEPGSGWFTTSWQGGEINPAMGKVTVSNPNRGIAWGALYWQYFEQLDKITPASTPLTLAKELFKEVNTPEGPKLEKITESTPLKIGDKVVVRVILKTDRNMEYVHLKDMRASAFEPVNTLSGYRWQAGLGYYESVRDAATHFFIDYLPKGSYVFEYRLHATQRGDFSNGITSVQCMYAPQFGAHSEGIRVKVE